MQIALHAPCGSNARRLTIPVESHHQKLESQQRSVGGIPDSGFQIELRIFDSKVLGIPGIFRRDPV